MTFADGERVRFKPGKGTYGYEDSLEADGRVPGVVLYTHRTGRVRVELTLKPPRRRLTTNVAAASLIREGSR